MKREYLCITRRTHDRLLIGEDVEIVVVAIRDGQVTLAIKASKEKYPIKRRDREYHPWRDDRETKD